MHSGRTNNKPQFHLGGTKCPVRGFLSTSDYFTNGTDNVSDQLIF